MTRKTQAKNLSKTAICLLLISLIALALILQGIGTPSIYAASLPEAEARQEVDVWLIGGQSNAVGYGTVSNYPSDEGYAEDKALLTAGSQNVWYYGKDEGLGNNPTDFVPAGFGLGQTAGSSGAELGITTALNGNGRMNAVIKVAYGSSYVYPNTGADISVKRGTWTSPTYIDKYGYSTAGNKTGDLYWEFLDMVSDGLQKLIAKGYTPVIRGMWWMQGEAETFNATTSGAYAECLTDFICDIRSSLSDISGTDCSQMPFVLGRLYRNPDVAHSSPTNLAAVQAAQDKVANDSFLVNVFKVDGATDLIDPATGDHTLPKQQDGWHFDALTQQMLGEAFITKATSVGGAFTKYGIIPDEYASADSYPLALFTATENGYKFQNGYSSWKSAFEAAVAQTHAKGIKTEEAVLLLRRDMESTEISQHASNIGSVVTLDLNGYTFAAKASFNNTKTGDSFTGITPETVKNGTVNIKNGTLLAGNYGLLYSSTNGTLTVEKQLTFNIDNVYLGFAPGATSKRLLIQAASANANTNAIYNMNLTNCVIDMMTNSPDGAVLAAMNAGSSCNSDHIVTFKNCEFIADSPSKLTYTASANGDAVRYIKGEDGYFGKVTMPEGTSYSATLNGIAEGNEVTVTPKALTASGETTYALIAKGSVPTAYGAISSACADAAAYPFAVFSKNANGYSFVGAYNGWQSAMNKAIALTHGASGTTEEAVILLRANHVTTQIAQNTSDIGATVTVDLNGYTLTATASFCNTKTDDYTTGLTPETVKNGTINVKNGSLLMGGHGILYASKNGTYTVEKSLTFNFDNVYIGYCEGATSATLLARAYNSHTGVNTVYNMNFVNCVIDMVTNAPANTVIGDLEADKNCFLDCNLTFKSCTFLSDTVEKLTFVKSTEGDSVNFIKDENSEYPKLLLNVNTPEPTGDFAFDTVNGKSVMPTETTAREGLYRVYEFSELISTQYGVIPNAYANYVFAVFAKNGSGYEFDSAHNGWSGVMGRAITLTHGATGTTDEAVILLLTDHKTTELAKGTSAIGSTVTVDLNGKTLTVCTSFCNTQTADYSTGITASNAKNGTINVKNGTLLVRDFGLVYSATGGTYTVERTLYMNYEDLTIGFADDCEDGKDINLLTHAYGCSTTVNANFKFTYKNCVIDMVTNTTSASRLGKAQTAVSGTTDSCNADFDLTFEGCTFKVYTPSQIEFSNKSANGDRFTFKANENGKYSSVLVSSSKLNTYYNVFTATEGIELSLAYTGKQENGMYLYELELAKEPENVKTDYADIPYTYGDAYNYPFAVFYKDTQNSGYVFDRACTDWVTAMNRAVTLTSATTPKYEAVVLLRSDNINTGVLYNTANIQTTVTLDLGGNTFTTTGSFTNTKTKDHPTNVTAETVKDSTVNIKNGTIKNRSFGLLYTANGGTYTVEKTFRMNFENVTFGFAPASVGGKDTRKLLVIAYDSSNETNANYELTFTNCIFDLATNAAPYSATDSEGIYYPTIADLHSNTEKSTGIYNSDHRLTFIGGKFIISHAENLKASMSPEGDSVVFATYEGKYPTVVTVNGAEAPVFAFDGVNGEKLFCIPTDNANEYLIAPCTHSYDDDHDEDCNNCGEIREIKPEITVVANGKCGVNTTWTLTSDGVLTISGNGDTEDYLVSITTEQPYRAYQDQITKVVFTEGVTSIGRGAFYGFTAITEVVFPDSLIAIHEYAFFGCSALKSIVIPENTFYIGMYAFRKAGIIELTMPMLEAWEFTDGTKLDIETMIKAFTTSATYKQTCIRPIYEDGDIIAEGVFGNKEQFTWTLTSTGLLTVSGKGNMPKFNVNTTPWYGYRGAIRSVVIEEGITSVGRCSFHTCRAITSVTLPEALGTIAEYAFYNCQFLTEATIPANVTRIEIYAFRKCFALKNVEFALNYGWSAGDSKVSATELNSNAADMLTLVNYTKIWTRDINAEEEVLDPNYVIGGACNTTVKWALTYIDDTKTKMKLTVSGTGAMPKFETADTPWYDYLNDIVEVEVCEGITEIGRCSFYGLKFVKTATIANTVTAINDYAFNGCFSLKTIEIPESVTFIAETAFTKTGLAVIPTV